MMLLPTTTRWLCIPSLLIVLLFILVQDGTCQLSVGAKDAFLLEDLDGDGAKPGAGNVPQESSSLDAASNPATNAAGVDAVATKAYDSSSPETTQTDAVLTSPPTDELFEDSTNNDFDDYMTDEQEQTTEPSNPPTDSISRSTGDTDQYDYPSEDRKEAEEVTSSVPQLTRRIVFAGPSVTPIVPEPSATFSRPSSVVRGFDNSDIDAWLPNWPSELLQNSGGPTRRPTIRFPTEPPLSVFDSTPTASPALTAQPTINPSYTVSKVPVTQYYFDLTSVAPSPVPGPLYDEEDLTSSSLASPTIRPDMTHQITELSSSLSDLQSSSPVEAAGPLSITPTLSVSQEATVTIPGFVTSSTASITPSPTPALSEASTRADDGLESEMVDNTLDGDSDSDSKTLMEDPQAHDTETSGPRPPQSHPDPQDADPDYTETATVGDVLIQASTTVTAGELPAPNTDSHPMVAPTATADPTETPTHTVHPEGPVVEVTEEGTHEEHPEKEPGIVKDETLPVSTHTPPSSDSPSLLPTSSVDSRPPVTSISTSPTSPPVTTSPELPSITSPEPTRVTSSEVIPVSSGAPVPVTTPEPKTVTTPPVTSPQPPPFSVTTPLTTTTTTTEKSTTLAPLPTTTTTPVTTPEPTYASPTEPEPSLTTTMLLPNGTMVEAPLPHIRALVTYTSMEFCRHRRNFRAMFSQWITQHLSGQAKVKPKDIEFFNMPTCPANPTPSPEEDHMNDIEDQSEDRETNVYFYITRSGVMDPNLTEQFPRFPMDLDIDEDLTYLRPKVTQLELVRGHGASNTDLLLEEEAAIGTSVIVIIVICSIVGITIILALLFFMVVKRRGATNNYYGRRCTPVSMDAYSMDSVSVYHSFRRKSKRRASGRSIKSYLNQAFDDPNGPSRPLNFAKLTHFISDIDGVYEEFGTIPVNMPKYDELPAGVEDKNRYANVIPVPETRVLLKANKESRNSEYINANYVRGARNESKYYIATQAPLDDTVADFWRMIWEQETRVVVMLTDFVEKGIDKCADYLPPSETLDCHRLYGDFQVTLKSRDMKEKFVVSNVQLKNLENNLVREVAHMWFTGWPASGVPNEEAGFISFILEVRRTRKKLRAKGPIVVHCSPGTGRTGTLLACDIVMKQFEDQRSIDVPRTVYSIRRDRAGAVQTKEQYAFIYRVINLYASKLTSGNLDSL